MRVVVAVSKLQVHKMAYKNVRIFKDPRGKETARLRYILCSGIQVMFWFGDRAAYHWCHVTCKRCLRLRKKP